MAESLASIPGFDLHDPEWRKLFDTISATGSGHVGADARARVAPDRRGLAELVRAIAGIRGDRAAVTRLTAERALRVQRTRAGQREHVLDRGQGTLPGSQPRALDLAR